jgi:hypothetical protein
MAIFTLPIARVGDSNFRVGSGFKLYFYDAGTTDARDTFTSNTYTTPLSNPVIADASGYFPVIWTTGDYKVRLTTAADVLVWEVDNYSNDSGVTIFAEGVLSAPDSAANVITANLSTAPAFPYVDQLQVVVELQHGANTTANPTFNLNGLGAKTIVKQDAKPLAAGDSGGSGCKIYLSYSETLDRWVLLNPQGSQVNEYYITSDQTYTPKVGTTYLVFQAIGGGGGGGGIDGQGADTGAASEGGGSGGYCRKSTSTIEATYAITIGAGGAGGTAGENNGGNGVATTVVGSVPTLNMSAGGGGGGAGDLGGATSYRNGKRGGASSGGDVNARGGASTGTSVVGGVVTGRSTSGSSYFGGSEISTNNATGFTAETYGAGGGACHSTGETANRAGGAGGAGVVIITEYVGFYR